MSQDKTMELYEVKAEMIEIHQRLKHLQEREKELDYKINPRTAEEDDNRALKVKDFQLFIKFYDDKWSEKYKKYEKLFEKFENAGERLEKLEKRLLEDEMLQRQAEERATCEISTLKQLKEELSKELKNALEEKKKTSKNYEQLALEVSELTKKVGSWEIAKSVKVEPEEVFTVEQMRRMPWLAVPEDYEVKCIWSRCEKQFQPIIYKNGLVLCSHCNRQTPIDKPPEGKKWMYFWNCWHIHSIAPGQKMKECETCKGTGELKESNIRVPTKKR